MKYVLVIYEGAADAPCEELEGATPLELARNVHATGLLGRGVTGGLHWPEDDPVIRAEHALACVLGVAPEEARALRRGPVEAAGTAVDPSRWTYAFRGNFVTTDQTSVRDNCVANLSTDETMWLAETIRSATPDLPMLMEVVGAGRVSVMFDRMDGEIDAGAFPGIGSPADLNQDTAASARVRLMKKSAEILGAQSLNDVRVDLGENPATMLWLWGGGAPVTITRPFIGAPLRGAMVTNSPLARGMAIQCGMRCLELGDVWTDTPKPELLEGDALATCIKAHELTVVYVEAPAEGGTYGTPVEKVKALDRLDIHVLSRVRKAMESLDEARLMVAALPREGVVLDTTPVLLFGTRVTADHVTRWEEKTCNTGAIGRLPAHRCLSRLIGD